MALILQGLPRLAHLLRLCRYPLLDFLKLLREGEVIEEVEDAEPIERREGLPVFMVGTAAREGGVTGDSGVPLGVGWPQGGSVDGVVRDGGVEDGTRARIWGQDGLAVCGCALRLVAGFWIPHFIGLEE